MFSDDINFMESYVKDSLKNKKRKINLEYEIEKYKISLLIESLFKILKKDKVSTEAQLKINEIKILLDIN